MRWSRQTMISGFLALTLTVCLAGWIATHPDNCTRYLHGDIGQEPSEEVAAGRTSITVPCQVWLPRQTPTVQALVAFDGILTVVACLSFWADRQRRGR